MRDQIILIYSYLHGIWRYRWSALVIAWLIALTGWSIVYALPNQYRAQAIIHVDTQSIMKPLLEGLTVESDVEDGLNVMSRVLLSRENLEKVARETDMDLAADDPKAMDNIVSELAASITLKSGGEKKKRKKDNNIYELSYETDSPELVYQVVSKLLNTLIENTLNSARTDTAAAQKFLDSQITEYESRLTIAEQKLAEFKRANLGLMPDARGGYYARLQSEQQSVEDLRSEIQLSQNKLSQLRKQLAGEAPLLDQTTYGGPNLVKIRRYREQLEVLLAQYTEQHPDVQALRATISDLKANENIADDELEDTIGGDETEFNPVYQQLKGEIHKTSIELETLKIQLKEKQRSVETLKKSIDVIPEVEAKLAKLNRDYEITRERYLSLVERREAARLAQQVGQSGSNVNFRIIDPPRIPGKPSGPNRFLLLSGVLLAALSAGLGWGFLMYLFQPTFIDASQIKDKIGLPILGSVNLYLTPEHKKRRKVQFASFLVVFLLLTSVYVTAVLFSDAGNRLVSDLMSAGGIAI